MKEIKEIALFEGREIRKVWHKDKVYFVVEDVVQALIDSNDPKQYIKRMKERDEELGKGWVQIVPTLDVPTKGGRQKMSCANLEGIFRIIQSIPSSKAEPIRLWLARVGTERLEEIQDPELAMDRAKSIYERKGYPEEWIDKRMRGINIRHSLTDEWKNRGVKNGFEFAILTDEIYKGTFNMTAQEYKKHKSLVKENNLRDHMNDIELILTMLGEATTTKLTQDRDSKEYKELHKDAKDGGGVAGRTRGDIERQTKKGVIGKENYLPSVKRLDDK
jgi:DNA-damage-inducible protein D